MNQSKILRMQSGQAMTEFLVIASLVLVPLFFGVYYLAKYSDIKHATIQASRYAAFERSWDPSSTIKSDAVIQDEVRTRFFSHKQHIHYQDNPAMIGTAEVQLWRQANQGRLLNQYSDVLLTNSQAGNLGGGLLNTIAGIGSSIYGQPNRGITASTVTAPLAEIGHFPAGDPRRLNLRIAATTAIGAGSWSSSGSNSGPNSTCRTVRRGTYTDDLGGLLSPLETVMGWLEDSRLDLGLIKPDIVPPGSLIRDGSTANPQNVPYSQQSGLSC